VAESPIHYLVIGHVAKDLTPEGPRLGGTVSFASLTARALGYAPGVVTACGADLDVSALDGIPMALTASSHSTTFENIYSAQGRQQYVRALAAPLTARSIPPAWLGARVAHLAPLDTEIAEDILPALGQRFVGVTPQGWLRQWDASGRVRAAVDEWAGAAQILSRANATVLSLDDIGRDWAVAERWAKLAPVLVITEGPEGCTVFVRGQGARQFAAPREAEVDPTGAGDVFAAAFFVNYYETGDAWASARFANQVAALSVTRVGLAGTPTEEEVALCRARAVGS
jgi:sugar/nucleoside kinase (ribokinase family)